MPRRKKALKAAQPDPKFSPPLPLDFNQEEAKIGKNVHANQHAALKPTSTTQAHSSKQLDSAYDAMVMQKYFPGTEVTPYVAGMNIMPSPSVTFCANNSQTETEVIGSQLDSEPLGTADYLVIAFCPVLTLLHGRGNNTSYGETTKLSGVIFNQSPSSYEPGIVLEWFDTPKYSREMLEIYGSDCTGFSNSGFVWSAEMMIRTLAPTANMVGTFYKGCVTLGQLQQGADGTGLLIQDLIEIATETGVHSDSQVLRSAVVNHDVVFSGSGSGTAAHSINQLTQSLQQEVVSYLILQKPVQNILTGENANFSLQMAIKGNAVFWPDARDTIANGIGRHILQSSRHKTALPKVFNGHRVNYSVDTTQQRGSSLADKIKYALEWAWDHRSEIGSALGSAISFAAPLLLANEDAPTLVVRSQYLLSIQQTMHALRGFNDPTLDPLIQPLEAELLERRQRLTFGDLANTRLIDTAVFEQPVQPKASIKAVQHDESSVRSASQPQYADHNTRQAALARYGVERNPGPVTQGSGSLPASASVHDRVTAGLRQRSGSCASVILSCVTASIAAYCVSCVRNEDSEDVEDPN